MCSCLCAVVDEEDEVREAVRLGQLDLVFEQGFASDGNHRLRQIAKAILQARARAAREDDGLLHV